jgi:CheY-like chemotaxis protein
MLVLRIVSLGMVKPLAMLVYEKLLPGSQLVNRLQGLDYRVQAMSDASLLPEEAIKEKPLVIILDLSLQGSDVLAAIEGIRQQLETAHIPILAFASPNQKKEQAAAVAAGANLVASDSGIFVQLPQLLEQVLSVE